MNTSLDHAGWRCLGAVHAALLAVSTVANHHAVRDTTTEQFRAYIEGHHETALVERLIAAIEAAIDETITKGTTP